MNSFLTHSGILIQNIEFRCVESIHFRAISYPLAPIVEHLLQIPEIKLGMLKCVINKFFDTYLHEQTSYSFEICKAFEICSL